MRAAPSSKRRAALPCHSVPCRRRCWDQMTLVFHGASLTFVTGMITSHATLARIVPAAFRRRITLVKSDKSAFVLAARSSEKLSFSSFKERN